MRNKLLLIVSLTSASLFPLESIAQTKILSFTSSIPFTNNTTKPYQFGRPSAVFASIGSNRLIAIGFNYWSNRAVATTNIQWAPWETPARYQTNLYTNNIGVPMGVAFVFRYLSPTNIHPVPVSSFTNSNHHTYHLQGSFFTTNGLSLSYFSNAVVTNVWPDYNNPGKTITNIEPDFWAYATDVFMTTVNSGTNWITNNQLGSRNTNYIIATGTAVPDLANDLWVDFKKSTNNRVVIEVYRIR